MKIIFLVLALTTLIAKAAPTADPIDPATKIDFKKSQIKIAEQTITVELAESDPQRERGLMFRKALAKDSGMLFVFDGERPLTFWMKNTLIPLSIGFFDSQRHLVKALEMEPPTMAEKDLPTYSSEGPAKYALEMPKDWFKNHHIKSGAVFEFQHRP